MNVVRKLLVIAALTILTSPWLATVAWAGDSLKGGGY
jgi:hypothetical protein